MFCFSSCLGNIQATEFRNDCEILEIQEDEEEEELYYEDIKPYLDLDLEWIAANLKKPVDTKSKATMMRPLMQNQCTQTEVSELADMERVERKGDTHYIPVPIPCPIFVPVPVYMMETPVPFPFPLPIPCPIPIPLVLPTDADEQVSHNSFILVMFDACSF